MNEVTEIASPLGLLRLRPEQEADAGFRYQLFCDSRLPEFALLRREGTAYEQLMRFQFQAQTKSYLATFPNARFDIIERDGIAIGRIVVNRPGDQLHIVDQAIVPSQRNQGIGTAIMNALMDEARALGFPVRLKVASSNDPSMRLYARLGFVPIRHEPAYIEMEWLALS